jgi:hypothetical protein
MRAKRESKIEEGKKKKNMIENFEEETFELTEVEIEFSNMIVERFKARPGIKNIITNAEIVRRIFERYGVKFTSARVRKMIQYIRVNGLLDGLVATNKGYFLATESEELRSWIHSVRQRIRAIEETISRSENYLFELEMLEKKDPF